MRTSKTHCVTCVIVRHHPVTHPLTCGNTGYDAGDARIVRHTSGDNRSQTIKPQVSALTAAKTTPVHSSASTLVTHPLTCGNTSCVTNRQNRHPFSHNGIRVRHRPPLRGARTHAYPPARARVIGPTPRPCQDGHMLLRPGCECAERAYLATASDEERAVWDARTGFDHSNERAS